MRGCYGDALRREMTKRPMVCFIGVYDVFSAALAGQHFDGIFISGFGFAASHYGLPDIGFIAWPDMVNFVQRVRTILPHHHIVVDIDDGYVDIEVAAHVVSLLEDAGASGVIMEDQRRPRRCGHVGGKQILELDEYLPKLKRVLEVRKDLVVVARTDATDHDERIRRAKAFAATDADAVLVDGLENLDLLREISQQIDKPLMFNQIAGGKSPPCTLTELKNAGVSMVNYSTPCLFSAQQGIEQAMKEIRERDGLLVHPSTEPGRVGIAACDAVLRDNLHRRDEKPQFDQAPTTHARNGNGNGKHHPGNGHANGNGNGHANGNGHKTDQSNSSPRNVLPRYAART